MIAIKKQISSLLIIIITLSVISPVLLIPKEAKALCPVNVVTDAPQAEKTWLDKIFQAYDEGLQTSQLAEVTISALWAVWNEKWEILKALTGQLLNLLLHQILAQLTNDITNWIENGTEPRFMSEGLSGYLEDAADNAMGNFIDQYLGAGWLCEPFDLDIEIALLDVPTFETEVHCTLSDIVANIDNFYDDFSQGGWTGWIELSKPQNNFYGAVLIAQDEKSRLAAEAAAEVAADAAAGGGFLSMKDCTWYDGAWTQVEVQTDVRGIPALPSACQPDSNNPGYTTSGYVTPCTSRCEALTPSSVVSEMANKASTNFFDTINAQISAATAKAGPYAVYVNAIVNSLINRVITEGVGLLKGSDVPVPNYGEVGESILIPTVVDPATALTLKNEATSLIAQLNLNKTNLENQLLVEQEANLAVLKLIPPAYTAIISDLNTTISACAPPVPYSSYVTWAQIAIDGINITSIPLYNAEISEMETVDIPKTVNMINLVSIAIASNQDLQNKVDAWLIVYAAVGGDENNQQLIDATTEVNNAEIKAIEDTQDAIKEIAGAVSSTTLIDLTQESMSLNQTIVTMAMNVAIERGDSNFPAAGTLYAELETVDSIKTSAQGYTSTCQTWTINNP